MKTFEEYYDEIVKDLIPPKCEKCGLTKDNYPKTTPATGSSVSMCHTQVYSSVNYYDIFTKAAARMFDTQAQKIEVLEKQILKLQGIEGDNISFS